MSEFEAGRSLYTIAGPGKTPRDVESAIRNLSKYLAGAIASRSSVVQGRAYGEVEEFLSLIFGRVVESHPDGLTCTIEYEHVDGVFRDLYQIDYSQEFADTSRQCIRIGLFAREMEEREFFQMRGASEFWERQEHRCESEEMLNSLFVGAIVLMPVKGGVVGRTLLDPSYLVESDVAVRLSDFDLTIFGKRISVQAFPYRKQDGVVLSCAEVSTLGLICYYSNEFSDYAYTMPKQLLEEVSRHASERVIPSRGLDYQAVGRMLRKLGFHPRRYEYKALGGMRSTLADDARRDRFRQAMTICLESGIPVLVNVQPTSSNKVGHSLVCVGLEDSIGDSYRLPEVGEVPIASDLVEVAPDTRGDKTVYLLPLTAMNRGRRFVVVDDSLPPYAIRDFKDLSGHEDMEAYEFLAPLTSDMALDVLEARAFAMDVLRGDKMGLVQWCGDALEDGQEVVVMQRMVSVRSYLRSRVATSSPEIAQFYGKLSLPGMGWLIEVCVADGWNREHPWEREAIAELLFDATTKGSDPYSLLVLARYPELIYHRQPNGETMWLEFRDGATIPLSFPIYDRSLRHIRAAKPKSLDDGSGNGGMRGS